jgi:hypothetical protein
MYSLANYYAVVGGRDMRSVYWFAGVFAIAVGVGLVAGPRAVAAERLIVPDLELDALKEAVRWPKADVSAVMMLAGRLMAGRRDAEGLAYFRDLLEKAGDREAAVAHYRKAAARTSSLPERNYLVTRAARLT